MKRSKIRSGEEAEEFFRQYSGDNFFHLNSPMILRLINHSTIPFEPFRACILLDHILLAPLIINYMDLHGGSQKDKRFELEQRLDRGRNIPHEEFLRVWTRSLR